MLFQSGAKVGKKEEKNECNQQMKALKKTRLFWKEILVLQTHFSTIKEA
jgi:hypothetical protein